ncbi:phosphate ABC transporter substrate-binding protein [Lentibacillus sp. L22]|uniref:phosphate ABC transporter substrate-binding protein n=1 Tax=Lentibacillus sp. L22 TaxID=3163028 RepID=UPI003466232B
MKVKNKLVLITFVTLMVFVTACGNSANGKSGSEADNNKDKLSGSVIIGGSSALQPLATAAAEQFMNKYPNTQVQVQGGGSGTGLSEVAAGNLDIGNSDYFVESQEGIPADKLVDHRVAVVGITAAVHPDAGVTNLSKSDLIKIFTGKIKNWKEVGGKDEKITLVNRPDGSGTRATFINFALDGTAPAEGITEDSSNTVKKIIAETPGAIGYLAFSYFDDSVVKMNIDNVEATDESIISGEFPIWAYEHMYTNGKPDGAEKAFLEYMMSDTIQNGPVAKQGYIPASKMNVERNAQGEITKK